MKILPRNTGIWIESQYDGVRNRFSAGNSSYFPYQPSDLFAVENEEKDHKYVKCSICGAIIQDTEESIEAHTHRNTPWTIDSCSDCHYYQKYNNLPFETAQIRNEEGKLVVTTKQTVRECCSNSFPRTEIYPTEQPACCKKMRCKDAEFNRNITFFDQSPDVFINIPMMTALDMSKWKAGDYGTLTRRSRYNIRVDSNNKKMITCFIVGFRNRSQRVCYSLKEKEWYRISNGNYIKGLPDFVTVRPEYVRVMQRIAEEISRG